MSDEKIYLYATREVEGEKRKEALWSKAIALSEGDEDKAKYKYVALRVEQIKKALAQKKKQAGAGPATATSSSASSVKKVSSGVDNQSTDEKIPDGYIPVSEYGEAYGVDDRLTIRRIENGTRKGKRIDGTWYIKLDKVEAKTGKTGSKQHPPKSSSDNGKKSSGQYDLYPAREYASIFGDIDEANVIKKIKDGVYEGELLKGVWHVKVDKNKGPVVPVPGYVTVGQFDSLTGIEQGDALIHINKGTYEHKRQNGNWYISWKEVQKAKERAKAFERTNEFFTDNRHGSDRPNRPNRSVANRDDNPKLSKKSSPQKWGFSWKIFLVSMVLASFINGFYTGVVGGEPRYNIVWTTLWIYLTIDAWNVWRWKALLPYPAYAIISGIVSNLLLAGGVDFNTYIVVKLTIIVGGLAAFYLLLARARENQVTTSRTTT